MTGLADRLGDLGDGLGAGLQHFEDPASHELLVADDLADVARTRLGARDTGGAYRAHTHTTSSMPSIIDLIWASV